MIAKPKAEDTWISIVEAANLMECSKSWVLALLRKGELTGKKIHSRAWMVSRDAALANLESYKEQTAGRRRVGRPRSDSAPRGRDTLSSVGFGTMTISTAAGPIPADDLITPSNASRESGFHRSWIYWMIDHGKLTSIEVGGVQFVRKSELNAIPRTNRGRPKKVAAPAKSRR